MVPDALWQHPDLELIDLKVWCALSLHARDQAETTTTNASLARTVGASGRTVKRSLSRLASTGFVRPEGETSKRVLHLCPDALEVAYTLRIAN
jgi:DNA-binding IclR family transcriptional regulator